MISFRNHVVTLLSVFLALAVGVALGGGPLSEAGRGTLSSTPRPVAPQDDGRAAFGDAFAQAAASRLYARGLEGHPVAVLTLPGADPAVVKGLAGQVERAAGDVIATYAAQRTLVDPNEKSLVDTLGSQLMTQLGEGVADTDAPTYERIGQLLGTAVASRSAGGAPVERDTGSLRQSLAGAEMVSGPAGEPSRAAVVLVLLGDDVDDDVLAGLLAGLESRSAGVVAVGGDGEAERDLDALRASPLAAEVATVDGADGGAGQVTAVLALIRSLTVDGGAFGASGSDGAVPLG